MVEVYPSLVHLTFYLLAREPHMPQVVPVGLDAAGKVVEQVELDVSLLNNLQDERGNSGVVCMDNRGE